MNNKEIIIDSLIKLKSEVKKRNLLSNAGVDLTNYENEYSLVSLNLISHILCGYLEFVTWWLYEDGTEIIIDKEKYDVESAEDFYEILIKMES